MKIPPNRIDGFLASPDRGIVAALVYGPDTGLVRERAEQLTTTVAGSLQDPFRVADLQGTEAVRDPARLVDEATALSLMPGRRVVRVRDAGDALTVRLQPLLTDRRVAAMIVIEASDLSPKSSLRRLCETAASAAAIPCYVLDPEEVVRWATRLLAETGFRLDRDAADLLADCLGRNRQLARREIEKLIAYMGDQRQIDLEAVRVSVGDIAADSLDDLTLGIADGDVLAVDRALTTLLAEPVAPVALLRSVQRHFTRLHATAWLVANGIDIDAAIGQLKPKVFFKTQQRFRAQVQRWSASRLAAALDALVAAEADCKRTAIPADTVCRQVLLAITIATRSRR